MADEQVPRLPPGSRRPHPQGPASERPGADLVGAGNGVGAAQANQLSDAGWSWYRDYLDALDAYDIDRYASFLADEVTIQFNNDDPMDGRDVARHGLARFWGAISGMGFTLVHEPLNMYGTDNTFVLEALNHYDKPDQARITVRVAACTDRRADGKVTSVRLYQDVSPLFAAS